MWKEGQAFYTIIHTIYSNCHSHTTKASGRKSQKEDKVFDIDYRYKYNIINI